MSTKNSFLWFLLVASLVTACNKAPQKVYEVRKVSQNIQITGQGTDPLWETAVLLEDFQYPWREDNSPPTSFRALWSDTHFFFLYYAEDPEIITPQRGLGERDAVNSDRVEIFFKIDDRMDPYYNLEMDALGRLFDAKGVYYRKGDNEWDWPEGHIQLLASTDDSGYRVEGAISLASLRDLGIYHDDHILKAGLFRGEYLNGDQEKPDIRWISWVIPDTPKPDFHTPSAFGELHLVP